MPNRPPYLVERSPGYIEYQLPISVKLVVDYHGKSPLLKNEREISGVIVTETANSITFKSAGSLEETILRSDIEDLRSSGLSLMPEGLENALKPQDLADVITYVRQK